MAKLLGTVLQKFKRRAVLSPVVSLLFLRMLSELSGTRWKRPRPHLEGRLGKFAWARVSAREPLFGPLEAYFHYVLSDFAPGKVNLAFPGPSMLQTLLKTLTPGRCCRLSREDLPVLDQERRRQG